jgi:hypothetical protein
MTDLPAWLREIRDRVDKATEGPWYVMEDDDDLCMCMVGVAKDPMNSYGNYGNTIAITLLQAPRVADVDDARWDENADFIAHSRADVPQLVELVAEMAEQLECLIPRGCDIECEDCMRRERERYDRCDRQAVLRMLAKYRGEVENNG